MQAHKLSVALFLISFVLPACSSPATIATETSRPTLAATESPSPTATDTPLPTPTATQASPQLEVVEWYRWSPPAFEGDTPNTYVEVLVRNPYDYPINVYEPAVELLHAGEVVQRTRDIDLYLYADAGWNLILPGEVVPGRICACSGFGVMQIAEWDSFIISAELEQATPIPYTTDLAIRTDAFSQRENGAYLARGAVTNSSGQPLKVILLRVLVRNAEGHFVGSGLIGVIGRFIDGKYESLEPGSVHEFWISAFTDPSLSEALSFEVTGFGILAEQ